jgi:hypothetical protein
MSEERPSGEEEVDFDRDDGVDAQHEQPRRFETPPADIEITDADE